MKSEGIAKNIVISVLGFVILIVGAVMVKMIPDAMDNMSSLPFICIGVGAGVFGGNLGAAVRRYILKKNRSKAKEIEIELKDERNIAISNSAKAKAYDVMQIVFGVLIVAFALMKVDMYVVLSVIAVYLFVTFTMVYYLNKFSKEM